MENNKNFQVDVQEWFKKKVDSLQDRLIKKFSEEALKEYRYYATIIPQATPTIKVKDKEILKKYKPTF